MHPDEIPELVYQMIDTVFLLMMFVNIFLMQLGFALLETGSVRKMNMAPILVKNVQDGCVVALCWCGGAGR